MGSKVRAVNVEPLQQQSVEGIFSASCVRLSKDFAIKDVRVRLASGAAADVQSGSTVTNAVGSQATLYRPKKGLRGEIYLCFVSPQEIDP